MKTFRRAGLVLTAAASIALLAGCNDSKDGMGSPMAQTTPVESAPPEMPGEEPAPESTSRTRPSVTMPGSSQDPRKKAACDKFCERFKQITEHEQCGGIAKETPPDQCAQWVGDLEKAITEAYQDEDYKAIVGSNILLEHIKDSAKKYGEENCAQPVTGQGGATERAKVAMCKMNLISLRGTAKSAYNRIS
ncbi:hypothetical protein EV193_101210 [Herbihabitans rhizosphaerae]|uniref:Uncharacterized protein n=1 Tax=Herbihabitans rhizosphaerae TaxID=1872711 RepID=A0A4Q7L4W0_9PSEU|nr:hypothetical protein [Herbihabitans rhizosphaerae]RZS44335.1 hypothetical protein EV193_101210 [Herbihabitans rhizosphaerae]